MQSSHPLLGKKPWASTWGCPREATGPTPRDGSPSNRMLLPIGHKDGPVGFPLGSTSPTRLTDESICISAWLEWALGPFPQKRRQKSCSPFCPVAGSRTGPGGGGPWKAPRPARERQSCGPPTQVAWLGLHRKVPWHEEAESPLEPAWSSLPDGGTVCGWKPGRAPAF